MNIKNGYVKLPRDFFEDAFFKGNTKAIAVMVFLLSQQVYQEETLPRGDVLQAGDVLTSRKIIAENTGLSEQEVRTIIEKMVATKLLTKLATKYDRSRKASIYHISSALTGVSSTKSSTKSATTIKKYSHKGNTKKEGESKAEKTAYTPHEKEIEYLLDAEGYIIGVK